MALHIHEKGIFNFKNHTSWQKLKSVNHFVFLNFYFGAKNARQGNSLVVRRVSQSRIIIVLCWTKYAVTRQFKPGILKLTTSRGKRNLLTVFSFVSFEEKGCYRIVSLGHQNFDCRSYCGHSRRMQGVYRFGKIKFSLTQFILPSFSPIFFTRCSLQNALTNWTPDQSLVRPDLCLNDIWPRNFKEGKC